MADPFLTAEWRSLLMLNYRVDPARVATLVPAGCELDFDGGETFVSVVGFMFTGTRLKGVPVPFHQDFEEVNLRYYIRRTHDGEPRRAVGFVKEIVPRWAIATMARLVYNENYVAVPMRHTIDGEDAARAGAPLPVGGLVSYGWESDGRWQTMSARIAGPVEPLQPGSHQMFIAEHYWGYATQRGGGTVEYQVEHPPWRVYPATDVVLDVDVRAVWGDTFADTLSGPPHSAFVAEGSLVTVYDGTRIA